MATVASSDQVRDALKEALDGFGLTLEVLTWKEDLSRGSLTLSLKVSGDLDQQQELPFTVRG